jgi:transposase-like protein
MLYTANEARNPTSTVRNSYTAEFKRESVRRAKERGNITAAARDLGISDTSLENWKRQLEQTPEMPSPETATRTTKRPLNSSANSNSSRRRTKS